MSLGISGRRELIHNRLQHLSDLIVHVPLGIEESSANCIL
jgi:hypothetical protein